MGFVSPMFPAPVTDRRCGGQSHHPSHELRHNCPSSGPARQRSCGGNSFRADRSYRSTAGGSRRPIRSEEHTSELQSLMRISYAVFCLKKKKKTIVMITPYGDKKAVHTTRIVRHTSDMN